MKVNVKVKLLNLICIKLVSEDRWTNFGFIFELLLNMQSFCTHLTAYHRANKRRPNTQRRLHLFYPAADAAHIFWSTPQPQHGRFPGNRIQRTINSWLEAIESVRWRRNQLIVSQAKLRRPILLSCYWKQAIDNIPTWKLIGSGITKQKKHTSTKSLFFLCAVSIILQLSAKKYIK